MLKLPFRLLTCIQTASSTFCKICQDVPKALERVRVNVNGSPVPFLDYLIPTLLQDLDHNSAKIRSSALTCIVPFIEPEPTPNLPANALSRHLDTFLSALFKRASDPSPLVRKQVCTAMVALLANRANKLLPEITGVVDYVLHCTMDEDQELALEACEFWLSFSEDPELHQHLLPFLPRVGPVLLDCTKYDDDELFALGAYDDENDNDAAVPDKAQDIKPRAFGGKTHTQQKDTEAASTLVVKKANALTQTSTDDDEDDEEEEEDDEDDGDDDDDFAEWTLRKCAAAALDVMATAFDKDLMAVLLPHLKNKLDSEDWLQRESGILTIGAIAEGPSLHTSEITC